MRIRLAVICLLLASLSGCSLWGKKPVRAFADATGGEQLERVFWQELKAKNYVELERRLASNFVGLGPTGSLNREAEISHLHAIDLRDYTLSDFQVEWNGSTAFVTYTASAQGIANGQPFSSRIRALAVWHRGNHEWIRLAYSWTTAQ